MQRELLTLYGVWFGQYKYLNLHFDDKFYQIEGNRKYLRGRLRNLIEESKPELFEDREMTSTTNKTIKEFVNSANLITK